MSRPSRLLCLAAAVLAGALLACPASAQTSPYTWKAGPPSDPNWFMLGVWYQAYITTRFNEYKSIGLTNWIDPGTPSNTDLSNLRSNGFKVMTEYSSSLLSLSNQGVIDGWIQMDEPDNAQQDSNYLPSVVYGPCVDPNVIIARYNTWKAADPNRPVYLGLGQGVCWPIGTPYYGRGSGSTWSQYQMYCQGADIIAFDVYPYNERSTDAPYQKPWYVAIGVDRLRSWTNYSKPIWVHIETTHISGSGVGGPKPYQTKAEVWMALIHGAVGVDYFAHSWVDDFHEDGLFSTDPNVVDQGMVPMLTALDAQIKSYSPLLYSPTYKSLLDPNLNMNYMVKADATKTYIFAVGMRDSNNLPGTISLTNMPASMTVDVTGEGRTKTLTNGSFTDDFSSLSLHLYTVPMPMPATLWSSTSGLWNDSNRWSAGEPNVGIRAIVTNGGTATISQAGKPYSVFLIAGLNSGQAGTVNMTGGSLYSSMAYVGYDGNGAIAQSGGLFRVDGNLYVGQTYGSFGRYVLTDGNLTVTYDEYLGLRGKASFTQSRGVHLARSNLYLGYDANGSGTYALQDGNLIVSKSEYVGLAGTGSFTQSGGRQWVDGNLFVGSAAGGLGTFTLSGGTLSIKGRLRIGATGTFHEQGGLLKSSGADANALLVENNGQFHVASGSCIVGSVTGFDANILAGSTVLDGGTSLTLTRIKQDRLSVGAGALATVRGPARITSTVRSLEIAGSAGAWTGKIDIASNYLIVKDGNLSVIGSQVRQAANFPAGQWNGTGGITSSSAAANAQGVTAIGFADNAVLQANTFGDANGLAASGVLLRYTYVGDTNLDGKVDLDTDYYNWSYGYLNSGVVAATWMYGDFNYDGVVDLDKDYYAWSYGYLNQSAPLAPEVDPLGTEALGASETGASALGDASGPAVPEPATLAALTLGVAVFLRRARRGGRRPSPPPQCPFILHRLNP